MILLNYYRCLSLSIFFKFCSLVCMEPSISSMRDLIDNDYDKTNKAYAKALTSAMNRSDMQSLKVVLLKIVDPETAIAGIDFLIKHTEDENELLFNLTNICTHEKNKVMLCGLLCSISYQKIALFKLILQHLNDSGMIEELKPYINDKIKSPLLHAVKIYLEGNFATFELIKRIIDTNMAEKHILSKILFESVSANDAILFDLISQKIDIALARGYGNRNILYEAVVSYKVHNNGIIPLIRIILEVAHNLLDAPNDSGITPRDALGYVLIKSLENNDTVAFKFFADFVPLCRLKNNNGDTVLHLAINKRALQKGNPDFVDFIVEQDPRLLDIENNDNVSPRQLLESTRHIS